MPPRRSLRQADKKLATAQAVRASKPQPSTRSSERRHSPAKPPAATTETYDVESVLARSLDRAFSLSTGRKEYHYLVRWQGYGPDDDTWEPRSVLMDGAAESVNEFEASEMPFTLLDVDHSGRIPLYLVRYGTATDSIPASPSYQTAWLTIDEMREYNHSTTLKKAIRLLESDRRKLRQIISRRARGSKDGKVKKALEYLVLWQESESDRENWLSDYQARCMFGESWTTALAQFRESRCQGNLNAEDTYNEYEEARKQQIQENQALLMGLLSGP